jgi:hypothetical protein
MKKKKQVVKPTPVVEVRFLYGGTYRVEVCEQFATREEAMAFAKTIPLPVKETADCFD